MCVPFWFILYEQQHKMFADFADQFFFLKTKISQTKKFFSDYNNNNNQWAIVILFY